jgi:hypothetical protein
MAARRELLDTDLKSIDEKAKAFAERGTYNYGERPPVRDDAATSEVRSHRRADGPAAKDKTGGDNWNEEDDDEDVMKTCVFFISSFLIFLNFHERTNIVTIGVFSDDFFYFRRRRKSGTPMSDIDDEALGMMNSEQHEVFCI